MAKFATCSKKVKIEVSKRQVPFCDDAFVITEEMEQAYKIASSAKKTAKQILKEGNVAVDLAWEAFKAKQPLLPFDEANDRVLWTDQEVDFLIGACLDDNLSIAKSFITLEIRSVLEWLFAGDERLLRDGKNQIYWAPVEMVPFSFRFCCGYFGYDFKMLREGTIRSGIEAQNGEIEALNTVLRASENAQHPQEDDNAANRRKFFEDKIMRCKTNIALFEHYRSTDEIVWKSSKYH